MAIQDTQEVIGINKVVKDLDSMFKEFKVRRKIVDTSSKKALKPMLSATKAVAPVAEQDLPAYFSRTDKGTPVARKAIKKGTLRKALFIRKKKNWQGLIIRHGANSRFDAWYWRFSEYGFMWQGWGWKDVKENHFWVPGKHMFRKTVSGSQRRVLAHWLRSARQEMTKRIPRIKVRSRA
jgi:hypothetical protein